MLIASTGSALRARLPAPPSGMLSPTNTSTAELRCSWGAARSLSLGARLPLPHPSRPASDRCLTLPSARFAASRSSAASSNRPASAVSDVPPLFNKILIANRGEIACRVIRTARRLGIKTVAVYSDADRNSLYVQMADEAYHIGGPASKDSYLRGDRILEACRRSGAEAVHPGYGFLSENAEFSDACAAAGVVFIGPPASAMTAMASKSASKKLMIAANVPVTPGYHGEDQSLERLRAEADKIGYPVMLKAWMGGGGKGMRAVHSPADFADALESARREARSSFGDDRMLIEKLMVQPRHIEVQVVADSHGNAVYLFERDCSVQRRHQKVIEEAPAPGLTTAQRVALGEAAVRAAKAVGYVNAGTVEFIADKDLNFAFMEMNTRLQVEHPITEAITGQDLVEWQLAVASGRRLPLEQSQIAINGHAFEARIYAENPLNNYLPGTGQLVHVSTPTGLPNVRIDTGVRQGDEVSIYYDPMIAKLVVWGEDRAAALRRLRVALERYQIVGLHTNIEFLHRLASHKDFVAANVDTGFLVRHAADVLVPPGPATDADVAMAAAYVMLRQEHERAQLGAEHGDFDSPWVTGPTWEPNGMRPRSFSLCSVRPTAGGLDPVRTLVEVGVIADAGQLGSYTLRLASGEHRLVASVRQRHRGTAESAEAAARGGSSGAEPFSVGAIDLEVEFDGRLLTPTVVVDESSLHIFHQGAVRVFELPIESFSGSEASVGSLRAPMPGKITKIHVKVGDVVAKGQPLLAMEAMKMEMTIRSTSAGVVKSVLFAEGEQVAEKAVLAVVVAE